MRHDSAVLNTLRATAVSLVLVDHVLETLAPLPPYDWYMGRLGVLFFFVHTCCVLMMSMQRTPLEGGSLWANFFLRRFFRIYPLNSVAVCSVLLMNAPITAWGAELPDRSPWSITANLLIAQELLGAQPVTAPLWSLPVEIQMYALLPAIFGWIGPTGSVRRAVQLWLGSVVLATLAMPLAMRLPMFAPCFLSGVIGFSLSHRVRPHLPFWLWPVTLAGLIGVYVGLTSLGSAVHSWPAAWVTCLLTGVLLPRFHETSSSLRLPAEWLARYSYGVYLFHMPSLWVAFRVVTPSPSPLGWALFFALTFGTSVVAFHLIEAPMIRLGSRVAQFVTAPLRLRSVSPS